MVYKKFIKRDGKVFGPYYYESYRDSKGHVKTRFISGPKKTDKINLFSSKKMFLFIIGLGIIFAVTLLLFLGNLSYNARTTGRVIDSNPSFGETAIAEQLADNSITSNVDVRDSVDLEVKDVPLENNKIMEFSTPNGKIELNFDLLNYSEFVKTETEDIVEASGFDINVTESKEKYKWGYNVKLADLNFIARIDVTSNQTITVINNQTLRIGEAYLSFADLASQGYTLSINSPVLLNESLVVNETIVINETNVTEMNVSNITEVVTNISIGNESSGEIINITNETIVISNESEGGENISVGNESVENVTVGNETTEVVINESIGEDSSEENSSEVLVEDTPEETVLGEVPGENTDVVETPVIDEVPVEEVTEPSEPTVTEEVVNTISGFVVHGVYGLTGFVVDDSETDYENTVSVYVQKNFNGTEYNIGDIINLDPSLVFFEQSTPGNIDSCQKLNVSGTYVLTRNLSGSLVNSTGCFNITVSNVELNCNGYYIRNTGISKPGIYAGNVTNATVRNCNITMSTSGYGIQFSSVNNSRIVNNLVGSNNEGIFVYQSYNNNISGNNASFNSDGILVSFSSNQRIINNTLYSNDYADGIRLYTSTNNQIINNTARLNDHGIYLDTSSNNNITGNIVSSNLNGGIYIVFGSSNNIVLNNTANLNSAGVHVQSGSDYNQVTNNTLNSNGNSISLSSASNNNFTNNNIWNCTNVNYACISFYTGSNNILSGGVINQSLGNLIYLQGNSDNNLFKDMTLLGSTVRDVNLTSISINNTFINVSYDFSKEGIDEGSSLIRKWYYRTYINDSSGNPISGANITVYNSSGGIEFSGLFTNSSGWTNLTTITDYVNDGFGVSYFSNYIINATNSSYPTQSHSYNVTLIQNNNLKDVFTLLSSFEVSNCQLISSSGVYNQTSNIVPPAGITSCINITSSNVLYDCGGKWISNVSLAVFGIYAYNVSNVTIRDCNITMSGSSGGYGIRISYVNNSFIINNTVNSNYGGIHLYFYSNNNQVINTTANSNSAFGIRLQYSNNNTITSGIVNDNNYGLWLGDSLYNNISNINASNDRSYGIALEWSDYNSINNATTITPSQSGLYMFDSDHNKVSNLTSRNNQYPVYLYGDNNTLSDINLWNCTYAYTEAGCLYVGSSNNNTFSRGIINFSSANLINLYAGRNNRFYDLTLLGASKNDTKIFIGALNNTLVNISYNSSREYVESGSQLIRKWYYSAYINDSLGNSVSGANVTVSNISGAVEFSTLTNSSGWINVSEITEYVNNGDNLTGINRSYSSNYTINVNTAGLFSGSKVFNITALGTNIFGDVITLSSNLSCGTISSPGVYYMDRSLSGAQIPSTGCFNITVSNVTLDCQNHYIFNNTLTAPGIYAGNVTNVTVKNCNITTKLVGAGYGIKFENVNYSFIISNLLNSNGDGIYLGSSSNNNITGNTINSNFNSGISLEIYSDYNYLMNNTLNLNYYGLYIWVSSNNIINESRISSRGDGTTHGIYLLSGSNNTFIRNNLSSNFYGITLYSASDNIFINNNIINCSSGFGVHYDYCLSLLGSSGNLFDGGLINLSMDDLIKISSSSNNAFRNLVLLGGAENDTILTSSPACEDSPGITSCSDLTSQEACEAGFSDCIWSSGCSGTYDGYGCEDLSSTKAMCEASSGKCTWNSFTGVNNTFINVSYNFSKEYVGSGSQLIRKWYYSVYVNNSSGDVVSGANVTAYNISSALEFSTLTNSSGWTGANEITEYVNNGNTSTGINRTYATPHVIYAGKTGVGVGSKTLNVSSVLNVLNDTITVGTNLSSCGRIDTSGTYTLSTNLIGTQIPSTGCFNITASNVTLDCQNHYILNTTLAKPGIYAGSVTNVTVKNCNVTMEEGMAGGYGIRFNSVNNSFIINSTLNSNYYGILLSSSSNNNQIINNTVNLDYYGIYLAASSNNNQIINNTVNSGQDGIYLASSSNNNITDNTVNFNGDRGLYFSTSNNNQIVDNTGNSNLWGIYLYSSSDNSLNNNTVNSNYMGIILDTGSDLNQVINNSVSFSSADGIFINSASSNNISNNTVTFNSETGITLSPGSNNLLLNNTINSNKYGVYLNAGSNNTLINNRIWNCTSAGVGCIYLSGSPNNLIVGGLVNFSSGNLIHISSSNNSLFKNIQLINATKNDTYLLGSSINSTFINVSYNSSKEYVSSGSQLIRKWYYRTYINNTSGNAVSGANVTAYNLSEAVEFSTLTNSSGWTGLNYITEYINSGNTSTGINITYSTPHLIYGNKANVGVGNKALNVSSSFNVLNDTITIGTNLSSCTKIIFPGVYTLTGNILQAQVPLKGCINITTSNVIFDCQNHYILNTSLNVSGIYAGSENGITNVTVRNCNVTMPANGYGIWFDRVNNSFIFNNTVDSNLWGIYTSNSSNNSIINNKGAYNFLALILASSSLNNISFNNFSGQSYMNFGADLYFTGHGIGLSQSNLNSITSNNLSEDGYGIEIVSSVQNNITNNYVSIDGYGIVITNGSNNNISGNIADYNYVFGIILQVNSSNNTVGNNSASYNLEPWEYNGVSRGNGITVSTFSNYNNVSNNNISSNLRMGIYVYLSERNNLSGNNISLNRNGIEVDYSYYNTVEGGYVINNIDDGITLYSNGYTFLRNVFVNTSSDFSGDGMLWIFNSSNNSFANVFLDSNGSIISGLYTGSINNTFTNVTYNSSKEYVESGSSLIRKWYYQVYVNDSNGNDVDYANVTAYNSSNAVEFSLLTNDEGPVSPFTTLSGSPGWTGLGSMTEYKNTGNTTTGINRTYASNYTIFAKKAGVGIGNKIFNLTSFGTNVLNDTLTINNNLSSCTVIDVSGSYSMSRNLLGTQVPSTGCFNITTSNVTLDCQNHYILNASIDGVGIYAGSEGGLTNITVKNCNVTMSSSGYGIRFINSNQSSIFNSIASSNLVGFSLLTSSNNNITGNTARSSTIAGMIFDSSSNNQIINNNASLNLNYGIDLVSNSSNNNITGNIASSNGDTGIILGSNSNNNTLSGNIANDNNLGIYLSTSSNNTLINNTANLNSGLNGVGIAFTSSSNNRIINNTANSNQNGILLSSGLNNQLINNNVWNCTDSIYGCVWFTLISNNNNLTGGIINLSAGSLIYLSNSDNNTFSNLDLYQSNVQDVKLMTGSTGNVLINVSYNLSKESVEAGSYLTRKWYYQAYVNHTQGGMVNNASVYAANSSDYYVFNTTTNASGWIPVQTLTQYINNGTMNYVDIYMINATNITDSDGHYYNVSAYNGNNFNDAFTVNDTTVPYSQGLVDTFVCEGNSLSLYFNVTDLGWDLPLAEISPINPFYSELLSYINLTSSEQRIFSGVLSKEDAGGVNNQSKTHNVTVTLYDGVNTNSTNISITVIETNEQPSMENFETTYNVIEGDRFYHPVLVNDTEDGNSSLGNLYFNMTGANFTDINRSGILNILTNSSIRGSYTIEVCATDKGLLNPHENISSVCLQDGTNKTECKSFILNIVERGTDTGNTGGGNRGGGGGGGGASTNNGANSGSESVEEENIYIEENSTFERPNPFCGNWTACKAVYNLSEVIDSKVFFRGEQKRECKLEGGDIHVETRGCASKVNIFVKRKDDCFKNYLVVLDVNNNTVSRLEFVSGDRSKLNVQLLFDKSAYCPYCYDHMKDYDETDVDCGGSCSACTENPIRVYSNFGTILFFIILVCVLICGNIVILLITRYHLLKSEISEFRLGGKQRIN